MYKSSISITGSHSRCEQTMVGDYFQQRINTGWCSSPYGGERWISFFLLKYLWHSLCKQLRSTLTDLKKNNIIVISSAQHIEGSTSGATWLTVVQQSQWPHGWLSWKVNGAPSCATHHKNSTDRRQQTISSVRSFIVDSHLHQPLAESGFFY